MSEDGWVRRVGAGKYSTSAWRCARSTRCRNQALRGGRISWRECDGAEGPSALGAFFGADGFLTLAAVSAMVSGCWWPKRAMQKCSNDEDN